MNTMSNTKNTGGPAFGDPAAARKYADCESYSQGMTLRDYFAARAMAVILEKWCVGDEIISSLSDGDYDCIANQSYAMADAMLKAREQ